MTAVLWSPAAPTRCACAGAYRPRLNSRGKLVKTRDPAWSMAEQTRDPGCLQERFRSLARLYQLGYQHHTDSRKSGRGYPDVHLWAAGRGSAYAELKKMGADPSPDQVRVMAELLAAGHLVYLARPCCLLCGVVDELMADFAGTRCLYAGGRPDQGTPPAPDPGPAQPPPGRRPAPPPRPRQTLPGAAPGEPFEGAVGYVVPLPTDDYARAAVRELEDWLREAGFPPTSVPFPIRVVIGEGVFIVQARAGTARPGHDEREWRGGVPERPFPDHLIAALHARTVCGPSSHKVAWLIDGAPPGGLMPSNQPAA